MFKWSIRTKLLIGLGMLLVIVATLSWGGIHGLYAYRGLVRSLSRRVSELPLAGEFSRAVSDLRVALSQTRTLRDLAAAGQHAAPGSIQFARAAFDHHLDEVETALQRYRDKLAENPDRTGRISDSRRERQTVEQIEGVLARVRALRNDAAWLLDAAKAARLEREVEQLEELALQLPGFLHENIREFTDHARVQYRTLIVLSWITSVTVGVMVLLLVNLFYPNVKRAAEALPGLTAICGDALRLPFADKSFDVCYSNAVIEHVFNRENQRLFASEIMRVSRSWFVTTPNRWFPFEPHMRLPLVTWLPQKWQHAVGRRIGYHHLQRRYKSGGDYTDVCLLSRSWLRRLFPGSRVVRNGVPGFTPTFIVVGGEILSRGAQVDAAIARPRPWSMSTAAS